MSLSFCALTSFDSMKIASHDGLSLSPQNDFVWPRFDVVSHPYIKWGLGISIGVKFGDGANLPVNKLLLDISSVASGFTVPTGCIQTRLVGTVQTAESGVRLNFSGMNGLWQAMIRLKTCADENKQTQSP